MKLQTYFYLWNSFKNFFFPEDGKTGRGETLGRTDKLDWNLKKKIFLQGKICSFL